MQERVDAYDPALTHTLVGAGAGANNSHRLARADQYCVPWSSPVHSHAQRWVVASLVHPDDDAAPHISCSVTYSYWIHGHMDRHGRRSCTANSESAHDVRRAGLCDDGVQVFVAEGHSGQTWAYDVHWVDSHRIWSCWKQWMEL
jgi:hypothetical protein